MQNYSSGKFPNNVWRVKYLNRANITKHIRLNQIYRKGTSSTIFMTYS